MAELFPPTLEDKIACLQREIHQRERVYPRLVSNGTMRQAKADRELETMRTILNDYLALVPKGEDAAPADAGWRPDRPGWYWVRLSDNEPWYPFRWKIGRTSDGWWIGLDERSQPIEIGPYIPPPAQDHNNG